MTAAHRLPPSNADVVALLPEALSEFRFLYVEAPAASAGFPSPAGDYLENTLDFNEYLVRNKPATFVIRFKGDSLTGEGILDGDVGVVDRSLAPAVGRVCVAAVDGEILAKVYGVIAGRHALLSRNDTTAYPPVYLDQCQELQIWGRVYSVARRL